MERIIFHFSFTISHSSFLISHLKFLISYLRLVCIPHHPSPHPSRPTVCQTAGYCGVKDVKVKSSKYVLENRPRDFMEEYLNSFLQKCSNSRKIFVNLHHY